MFDLPKYGQGICLGRTGALLARLGIDRTWLSERAIVVAGSNGKGSTATMCAMIGKSLGLRVGRFLSPHLLNFNERFWVDGDVIGDYKLAALASKVSHAVQVESQFLSPGRSFGAFEAQFALACSYFQDERCDLCVLEAGIGARYDPSRLAGAKVGCVTSVDFEHQALLGSSLLEIACDKSDACASGGVVIYGPSCLSLKQDLDEYNRARGVRSLYINLDIQDRGNIEATPREFSIAVGDMQFDGISLALQGAFQRENACVAVGAIVEWARLSKHHCEISTTFREAVQAGLKGATINGRLEVVQQEPLVVIDVGHTPEAIRLSRLGLFERFGSDDWVLVTGVSVDKHIELIQGQLAPAFRRIVCTKSSHKGAPVEDVAQFVRMFNPTAMVCCAPDSVSALVLALASTKSAKSRVYVAGSLFLAAEIRAQIVNRLPPTQLHFF